MDRRKKAPMPYYKVQALVSAGPALPPVASPVAPFHAQYPASAFTVPLIRRQVEAIARECGLDGEALHDALLAVSEAVTNAVGHGSGGREDAEIGLDVELTELELLVTVSDSGKGLQPTATHAGMRSGLAVIAVITG